MARAAVAAGAVLTTNMCMGMFGAFGPHITHHLGWTTEAASGRLVSLMLGAVMVAQLGGRRASRSGAMALGVVFAVAGWSATTVGVSARIPVAVVLGSAVLGAGAGLCLLGSAALIGAISPPGQRAELYSAYLLVAFTVLAGTALVKHRREWDALRADPTALARMLAGIGLPRLDEPDARHAPARH